MPEKSRVNIRAMAPGDAHAVAILTAQLGSRRTPDATHRWIVELGDRWDQAAFVARIEDRIAGWIEVSVERRLQTAPFALIGGLVVDHKMRRHGIGRLLCQAAEEWASGLGIGTVRVTSRSTRRNAHRFYLRDGYQTVKTSLIFEKKLD